MRDLEFIYFNENNNLFFHLWDQYVTTHIVSYRYSVLVYKYLIAYSPLIIKNLSFVVKQNDKVLGICFLPIENIDGINMISHGGGFVMSPLAENDKIFESIMNKVDEIATKENCQKINFYLEALMMEYQNKYNYLKKYGYIDISSSDTIVDLRISKEELWQNIRKSYKSLINAALKSRDGLELCIYNSENITYDIFEHYRMLHEKCSGRVTRPKATFDIQYDLVKNDQAILVFLKKNNLIVGASYFSHYGKTAIYFSGADDPDFSELAIHHPILWTAMQYYKDLGIEFMSFSSPAGFNEIDGFMDLYTKKQVNIANFKRGMGANMGPLFRGVKYLNKELLLEDIDIFKTQCTHNIKTILGENHVTY